MPDEIPVGVVTPRKIINSVMYGVRFYEDDDASSTGIVWLDTRAEADRFLASLPEATR